MRALAWLPEHLWCARCSDCSFSSPTSPQVGSMCWLYKCVNWGLRGPDGPFRVLSCVDCWLNLSGILPPCLQTNMPVPSYVHLHSYRRSSVVIWEVWPGSICRVIAGGRRGCGNLMASKHSPWLFPRDLSAHPRHKSGWLSPCWHWSILISYFIVSWVTIEEKVVVFWKIIEKVCHLICLPPAYKSHPFLRRVRSIDLGVDDFSSGRWRLFIWRRHTPQAWPVRAPVP